MFNCCGCRDITGLKVNEISDQLSKSKSLYPFIEPEPACGISDRVAEQIIGTGCAESTRSTGSPSQDKDMQRTFF
jgi:hypothetical protein